MVAKTAPIAVTLAASTNTSASVTPIVSKKINTAISEKCKIWKTVDFCKISDTIALPYKINGTVDLDLNCKDLNGKNLVAVIVRVRGAKRKAQFTLKHNLQSISLIKLDGSIVQPYALSWGEYFNKAKDLTAYFKDKADFIILFPSAEPGDVVNIEGLIQAEIVK